MRIVGGKLKGRRFEPVRNFKGRPTTDFARESLFNILHNQLEWEESTVCDLFSGSGAISFEAASRGAERVYSVEADRRAAQQTERQTERFELDNLDVFNMDAFLFLEKIGEKFDLIIADPPFDKQWGQKIHQSVIDHDLLKPDGILVVEHSDKEDLSALRGFARMRKYGHVRFSFFNL